MPVAALAPMPALLTLRLLPGGDQWRLVAARIGLVPAFVGAYRAWLDVAARIARQVFTGRLSPEVDDWLRHEDPPPANALQALRANGHLALLAALGLSVSMGYVDFDSPLLKAHSAPKR